jgi:hypothetical protein
LKDFIMRIDRVAVVAIVNRAANVDDPVTDPLQFGCNLHHCGYESEVSSHRLMKGQELQTRFFQVDVSAVHVAVAIDDNAGAANIVFAHARERPLHLLDDQVSHLTERCSQIGKFEIKLFVLVFHGWTPG